jgi:phytoene/squalene synthetase
LSAEACAALVERGDPDRFRSAMVAPPDRRPGLMALYAFNLEVARAPWATSEPMLARIRLQWWLDALAEIAAGAPPRRHEVVEPLAATIRAGDLPVDLFEALVTARFRDAEPGPLPDRAALDAYVAATAGTLAELAARHLGAGEGALPVVRRFARGSGTAALLRAVPELRARGRDPLPPGLDVAVLARDAEADLRAARTERAAVPHGAIAAMLAGWKADAILAAVRADPALAQPPEPPEAKARATLLWRALSGRW